jgi:DUF4097 and DUF4098 domain-containing protein YvlB
MRIATVLVATLCVAAPARGQTIHVTIDQATAAEVIRDVDRLVHSSLGRAGDGLGDAIRELAGHAGALGHLEARQNRTFKAEKTDRETRTLAIGASGTLDLQTHSGDISVTAGSGRDVTLEIIRRARGRTDADVQLGLEQVKSTVDSRPDRARVRAVYPDRQANTYSVDVSYVVTAPAGTHVTAETISGNVTIKGIRGDVAVDVTSGDVNIADSRVSQAKTISGPVTLTDVETDGNVDVRSVSGTVTLQNVKARRLTADAVASGDITARNIVCDTATLKTLSGNVDFSGPLSKNGRYELGAFSGTVHFAPAGPAGFELQASTFSGDIRTDKSMTFRDLSLSRRSLRGTFGDGGAMVILKTFSGNVTIGK